MVGMSSLHKCPFDVMGSASLLKDGIEKKRQPGFVLLCFSVGDVRDEAMTAGSALATRAGLGWACEVNLNDAQHVQGKPAVVINAEEQWWEPNTKEQKQNKSGKCIHETLPSSPLSRQGRVGKEDSWNEDQAI